MRQPVLLASIEVMAVARGVLADQHHLAHPLLQQLADLAQDEL
jgi:hypothetical protein